jgi:hypothetical protein
VSGCWFPHAKFLIATQQLVIEGTALSVALLMEDSQIQTQLGAEFVADIAGLSEFDGSGYNREVNSSGAWVENVGVDVRFEMDDTDFGALGNGTERLTWTLVATDALNDAARIPLFFFGRSLGPTNPAGQNVTVTDVSVEL